MKKVKTSKEYQKLYSIFIELKALEVYYINNSASLCADESSQITEADKYNARMARNIAEASFLIYNTMTTELLKTNEG